jgi:hypothetical protein
VPGALLIPRPAGRRRLFRAVEALDEDPALRARLDHFLERFREVAYQAVNDELSLATDATMQPE